MNTNQDASLMEEINEQDLENMSGGTSLITYPLVSYYVGNKGYICTATHECMPNCR